MSEFTQLRQLKQSLAAYLEASEMPENTEIFISFSAMQQRYPLCYPTVAIGIGAIEAVPGGLGGHWGASAAGAQYGSALHLTIRFYLYAPATAGSNGVQSLYEALCTALMLTPNSFCCQRLTAGETQYDNRAGAFYLKAELSLSAALLKEDTNPTIQSFTLRRASEEGETT